MGDSCCYVEFARICLHVSQDFQSLHQIEDMNAPTTLKLQACLQTKNEGPVFSTKRPSLKPCSALQSRLEISIEFVKGKFTWFKLERISSRALLLPAAFCALLLMFKRLATARFIDWQTQACEYPQLRGLKSIQMYFCRRWHLDVSQLVMLP